MFTNKKAKYYGDNKVLLDSACLSSDTKPTTGVANGSKLLEMDTSTVYAFDEANGEWLAQSSSGGGGGGGESYLGIHTAKVNVTFDTSEVDSDVTGIQRAHIRLGYVEDYGDQAIGFVYGDGYIPVTELGTPTQLILPVSDTYPAAILFESIEWEINGGGTALSHEATVVSGSATGAIDSEGSGSIVITGDCSLNIKVYYPD